MAETLHHLLSALPPDAVRIAIVLLLSLFMGFEREEAKQHDGHYAFGGVRTFPLLGMLGYGLALVAGTDVIPVAIGFAVVGAFMVVSFRHKLAVSEHAGLTTEAGGLAIYLVGVLVQHGLLWIAATVAIISVLLLDLKRGLEGLAQRVPRDEIVTLAKFLVLAIVILPVLPDGKLTHFELVPSDIWLVVVAVSAISYGSYVLQRVLKGRGGVLIAAVLGGAYSSTVTTVVLARQAKQSRLPNLFAGATLVASAMMYARLAVLLAVFNFALAAKLAPWFAGMAVIVGLAGWLIARQRVDGAAAAQAIQLPTNPLQLRAAFLFAIVFVLVLVLTSLAREHFGTSGIYILATIMGLTDVDPFILGIAHGAAATLSLDTAALAIMIAAASNNAIKAVYGASFADRPTGKRILALLLALAALGMLPAVVR